jgi:hypothetical protein
MPIKISSDEAILHAILYSKGWYQKDDNLTGLRAIAEIYTGVGKEFINDEFLFQFVLMVHEKYLPKKTLTDFISETFKNKRMIQDWDDRGKPTSLTYKDFIESALSGLHFLKITEIDKLPAPNPEIYPLKDDEALIRWEKMDH